jgi:hypothetical protein
MIKNQVPMNLLPCHHLTNSSIGVAATDNSCMIGIIRSKKQLITAIKSSGSTPTTFTPIKFTRPVAYAAYGTSPFAYAGYAFSNVTA